MYLCLAHIKHTAYGACARRTVFWDAPNDLVLRVVLSLHSTPHPPLCLIVSKVTAILLLTDRATPLVALNKNPKLPQIQVNSNALDRHVARQIPAAFEPERLVSVCEGLIDQMVGRCLILSPALPHLGLHPPYPNHYDYLIQRRYYPWPKTKPTKRHPAPTESPSQALGR